MGHGARVVALLVPRVHAAWPAIGAIALAVVLAHSGVSHLRDAPELDAHYRIAIGGDGWPRTIGIVQLLAAGGLLFRRTRVTTASALGAVLVLAIANQLRMGRAGVATLPSLLMLLMLLWAGVVAWGETRRARRTGAPPPGVL